MAPPPAPKRIKRPSIVLDEDTYTSAISHIIRRDFFPGLAETDAQYEYLSALESKDKSWIREAGRKLTEVMTPLPAGARRRAAAGAGGKIKSTGGESMGRGGRDGGETPSVWGADTPVPLASIQDEDEGSQEKKKPQVDLSLSLTAFQSRYTSEDTESFSRLLDAANVKKFANNAWLHTGNNAYASKQRLAQQKVLEAAKAKDDADKEKGMQVAVRPSRDLDDRPAAPTTHKHTAFNSLMFPPESVEDWAPTRAQRAEEASLAPPKKVVHSNTRLPPVPDSSDLPPRPGSPTMSAVRDAISGRPRLGPSEGGYDGSETPRVNGYAFVDAEPPEPDDGEDDEDAPTDLLERLGANKGKSSFTIIDPGRREVLHHRMVEKINDKTRKSSTSGSSAESRFKGVETPRFLSAPTPRAGGGVSAAGGMTPGRKAVGDLTPAARMLFQRMGGGSTPRIGERSGFNGRDGMKARDWTPTPKVRRRG